jgi:Family of unknown function (DUF6074)
MTNPASLAHSGRRAAGRDAPHRESEARLCVRIDLPGAKVRLLPGHFRDAGYIRGHVEHVLSRSAEQGEAHVRRNLRCIRGNLEAMGVNRPEIDAEIRRIEAAVRAEIWRQVLLPDGDA